jgi:DNA-binding transcriptional ArsR family regulator
MVEYMMNLDEVFGSLADPTRRDILRRVARREQSVGQIAKHYDLTFAAISKHLQVLERAKLITKRRRGKEQMVNISPQALARADEYLEQYRELWERQLDKLEVLLEQEQSKDKKGDHSGRAK